MEANSRKEMRKAAHTIANANPTPAVSARAPAVTPSSVGTTLFLPLGAAISPPASIGPRNALD